MGKEKRIAVRGYSGNNWLEFIEAHRFVLDPNEPFERLIVDFSNTKFVAPYHLVSLACLIEEYHLFGVEIIFLPATGSTHQYLTAVNFYYYWEEGFDRNNFIPVNADTALYLWKVDQEMIDTYGNEAKNFFEKNFFTDRNLDSVSILLKEVFNNIYDHARSKVSGYVLTQYNRNSQQVRLAICDFGVGIPGKLNETWQQKGKMPLSHDDALRAAFKAKVSSKSTPRNRGLGLFYLLQNVKILAGDLIIWSNSGLLEHKNVAEATLYVQNNKFLRGTLIDVSLMTESFPQAEEIEEGEFNFY